MTCREHAYTSDLVEQMPMPEDALDRERDGSMANSRRSPRLGQRLEASTQRDSPTEDKDADVDNDGGFHSFLHMQVLFAC